MSSLKEQLIGVKDALIKHGRNSSGHLIDENGCLCLLGAAAVAVYGEVKDTGAWYDKLGPDTEASPVVQALADSARGPNPSRVAMNEVFLFNDYEKDDDVVLAVVDRAIEAADA